MNIALLCDFLSLILLFKNYFHSKVVSFSLLGKSQIALFIIIFTIGLIQNNNNNTLIAINT